MSARLTLTALIADGMLDAELGALLWQLADAGVPLVSASREPAAAELLRAAIGELLEPSQGLADGALPGGVVVADSLQEVLRLGEALDPATDAGGVASGGGVSDSARELGMVAIVDSTESGRRVKAVHYVRPIERDAAGHLQRRPPALLAAWDERGGRFDHFDWGITDELATRAGVTADQFEQLLRRRARLLADLAAAGVLELDELRRHLLGASLDPDHNGGAIAADAPH